MLICVEVTLGVCVCVCTQVWVYVCVKIKIGDATKWKKHNEALQHFLESAPRLA